MPRPRLGTNAALLVFVIALGSACDSPPPPQPPPPAQTAAPAPSPSPAPHPPAPEAPGPWPTFERDDKPPPAAPDGSVANVETVVNGMSRHLKRCYDRELKDNALAKGSVRLKVQIGRDGGVEDVSVMKQTGTLSAAFLRCLALVVRSRWFAKPPGGAATLELPLNLAPNPPPKEP